MKPLINTPLTVATNQILESKVNFFVSQKHFHHFIALAFDCKEWSTEFGIL